MDCSRTTNERDSDIGDDSALSHDENSDHEDDLRDCDSGDEAGHLNSTTNGNGMDYSVRSPSDHVNPDLGLGHHPQFPPNHALGVLGNFMGVAGLHNMPSLQHGDVLEKLKMQVRDMKVGLMDQDYPSHSNYGATLPTPPNTAFTLPSSTINNFNHQPQNLSQSQNQSQSHSHSNGFPFTPPNAPSSKDVNPGSNSSTSSEASNSSQQNNGWSFEEQFKQVRQLYEINDDPKRKEFLDDLFSFMQKRGTPINRLPIMAKSVLDLYELYNLVIARGGLVDVINKKLWQEIIKGLHLPSSITSAAFTLRTQYMKYLYPYECEKKNLSSPAELQAAIDGNRREGRRSSYGQFEAMHNQLQMPQMQRPPVPNSMQQMSPLALVTHHGSSPSAHHRLMAPPLSQMPNLVSHEFEQRMMEYFKLFQTQKDPRRSQSPDITPREALNALEMSRVALWSMYHNNTSPPSSVNTSPQCVEPQREALNLSESPPNTSTIKRTHDSNEQQSLISERDEFNQPPPAKRGIPHDFLVPANNHHNNSMKTTNSSSNSNNNNNNSNNNNNNNNNSSSSNKYDDEQDDSLADSSNDLKRMNCDDREISSQPTISHSHNGGLMNGEIPLLTGMQFKVTRRGNGINGEQQLVVNLELNGVQYEGVLFAMPNSHPHYNHASSNSLDSPSTSSSTRNGSSGNGGGGGGGGSGSIANETTVTASTTTASVDERTRSSIVSS